MPAESSINLGIWDNGNDDARSDRRKTNINKILNCIRIYGPIGIAKISERTRLDKSTVTEHCDTLTRRGLIKKKNKQAGYELTQEAIRDNDNLLVMTHPDISDISKIWQMKIPDAIIKYDGRLGTKIFQNKFCNHGNYIHRKKTKTKSRLRLTYQMQSRRDEVELSMFANKIGAMITLMMVEAIKPLTTDIPVSKERYLIENLTGEDRRKLAISWITQGMNPFTIFSEFCNLRCVKEGLAIWRNKMIYTAQDRDNDIRKIQNGDISETTKKKEIEFCKFHFQLAEDRNKKLRMARYEDPKWTPYEMDKYNFDRISKIYSNIFPVMTEKVSKQIKKLYEIHRDSWIKNKYTTEICKNQ
jgi:predicted transcriptional regulator